MRALLSDLENNSFKKDEKLVNICKELNGKEYYSALGSKEYIKGDLFSSNDLNIKIINNANETIKIKNKRNLDFTFLLNISFLLIIC